MRLIDADQFGVIALQGKSEEFIEGVLFILDKIYETPTVEPKHGEWIDTDVQYQDNGDVERRCSACGYGDRQSPSAIVPYCWHCGARMKEGEQK